MTLKAGRLVEVCAGRLFGINANFDPELLKLDGEKLHIKEVSSAGGQARLEGGLWCPAGALRPVGR